MSTTGRLAKRTSVCLRCQIRSIARKEYERSQRTRAWKQRSFSTQQSSLQEVHATAPDYSQIVNEIVVPLPHTIRKDTNLQRPVAIEKFPGNGGANQIEANTKLANEHEPSDPSPFAKHIEIDDSKTFRIQRTPTDDPPTSQRRPSLDQIRERSPNEKLFRSRTYSDAAPPSIPEGASLESGVDLVSLREKYVWRRLNLHRRDRLGVKALGEDAEIVTLEDHGKRPDEGTFYVRDEGEVDRTAKQPTYKEMLDEISNARKQGKQVDRRDVDRAMMHLKVKWGKSLGNQSTATSKGDFKTIRRQIHDSFTHEQLAEYYTSHTIGSASQSKDILRTPSIALQRFMRAGWILVKDEKDFPEDPGAAKSRRQELKISLRGTKKPNNKEQSQPNKAQISKFSLINAILRDCWKLHDQDLPSAQGSCDVVFLDDVYMKLLLNHRLDILGQVSKAYGARIQASLPLKYLRISGDYDTCLNAFQTISDFTLSSQSRILDVPTKIVEKSENLSSERFQEIEKYTNTVIVPFVRPTRQAEVESVQILFANGAQQDLEDAKRLLLRERLDLPLSKIECSMAGMSGDAEATLVPRDMDKYFVRQRKAGAWARLASPLSREPHSRFHERTAELLELVIASQSSFINNIIASTASQPQAWFSFQPNVHHQTSCSFGQLLCSLNTSLRSSDPRPSDALLRSKPERLFLPGGLGLQNLLRHDSLAKANRYDQLRLVLVPEQALMFQSRKQSEMLHRTYLELLLDVGQDPSSTSLTGVRLICDVGQGQAFLPHANSDIAFDTQFYIPFQCGTSDSSTLPLPLSIEEFLRSSNLNVHGQERLLTPGSLCLDLPSGLLGAPDPSTDERSRSDLTFAGPTTPTMFSFWALHHQSVISAKYKEVSFECKMIEAGKLEGKWEESKLILPKVLVSSDQEASKQALSDLAARKSKKSKRGNVNAYIEKLKERLKFLAKDAADMLEAVSK